MKRRSFLTGLGAFASGLAGCAGKEPTPTPGVKTRIITKTNIVRNTPSTTATGTLSGTDPVFNNFVAVDGTDFIVEENPVYFIGGNHPELRKQSSDEMSAWFNQWLRVVPNLNALRVSAWGSGTDRRYRTESVPLQPKPGEYNEEAFKIFDELIYKSGLHGVRLILPLTNNWDRDGGMPKYVSWVDSATKHDDFYTNPEIRELFKKYISYVLNRENKKTGVQYKNDPTILMWELANEPRAEDMWDKNSVLVNWAEDIASHIKSEGAKQLISSGIGGGNVFNKVPRVYKEVNQLSDIDVYSMHIWADEKHQNIGIEGGNKWITNHTKTAHDELGMPAYAGEFGWPVDRADMISDSVELQDRNEAFGAWLETMIDEGTNGALVWNLRHELEYPGVSNWNDYAVFPRDDGTTEILKDAASIFAKKSNG